MEVDENAQIGKEMPPVEFCSELLGHCHGRVDLAWRNHNPREVLDWRPPGELTASWGPVAQVENFLRALVVILHTAVESWSHLLGDLGRFLDFISLLRIREEDEGVVAVLLILITPFLRGNKYQI